MDTSLIRCAVLAMRQATISHLPSASQKMNKIIRLLAIVSAMLIAACSHHQTRHLTPNITPAHTPVSNDPLRLDMGYSPQYTGTAPASTCPPPGPPTCADNGGMWYDVSNWQYFLNTHGANPPLAFTNQFNMYTQNATAAFQGQHGLAATGKVDTATYNKATSWLILNPMWKYPTRPP